MSFLIFVVSLHLLSYFLYARGEGFSKTAYILKLALVLNAHIYDEYKIMIVAHVLCKSY